MYKVFWEVAHKRVFPRFRTKQKWLKISLKNASAGGKKQTGKRNTPENHMGERPENKWNFGREKSGGKIPEKEENS